MGTWGYEPLDSDAAMEIQYLWDTYVIQNVREYNWDKEQIVDYFIGRWGDAVNYGDNITNSEIIALVEIFRSENLKITKTFKKVAQDAINRELMDEEIAEWKDPKKRKKILLSYLDSIGGKIKKPKKKIVYNDSAILYKNKATAERELMKMTKFGRKMTFGLNILMNDELKKDLPDFLKTLDRFMKHGLWEKDSNIAIEAKQQRLMMLAFYLAMYIGYAEGKARDLIRDCNWEKE